MARVAVITLCAWTALGLSLAVPGPALAADAGRAEALSPAQAVELAIAADEEAVPAVVRGEALGEVLRAPGGRRWINILGEGVALGVVMDEDVADSVQRFGGYRQRGATLLVTGTLQRACSEHGGDLDMHATSVVVLDQGEEIPHAIHPAKLALAGVVLGLAGVLAVRYRHLRRRAQLS